MVVSLGVPVFRVFMVSTFMAKICWQQNFSNDTVALICALVEKFYVLAMHVVILS